MSDANGSEVIAALPRDYVARQRWFGSKTKTIQRISPLATAMLPGLAPPCALVLIDVRLDDGTAETYFAPFAIDRVAIDRETGALAAADAAAEQRRVVVQAAGASYQLTDAFDLPDFCIDLLDRMEHGRALEADRGRFTFHHVAPPPAGSTSRRVRRIRSEQSNTSLVFGQEAIFKGFRKIQPGVNPDLEITRFLTTKTGFTNTPPLLGYVEYDAPDGEKSSLGTLQAFVENRGDCWTYTLGRLAEFIGQVRSTPGARVESDASDFAGPSLADARRLGEITGQMHVALTSDPADPAFAPEPVTRADLQTWSSGMTRQVDGVIGALEKAAGNYSPEIQESIGVVAAHRSDYLGRIQALARLPEGAVRKIRHHGDYHLGQVLKTPGDFVVIDFEGEPARPIAERRAKHLALRDVAGMLRSFDYASFAAVLDATTGDRYAMAALAPWRLAWRDLVSRSFLDAYLATANASSSVFLPADPAQVDALVRVLQLDKAFYEVNYELNNRPDWLPLPLSFVAGLV